MRQRLLGTQRLAVSALGLGCMGISQSYGDFRRTTPRFQNESFAHNLAVVDRIRELADSRGVTPSQLAIAWVLAQGNDVVPIPGTKRRAHLEENLAALEVTLTPDDLASIEAIAPPGAASVTATAPR